MSGPHPAVSLFRSKEWAGQQRRNHTGLAIILASPILLQKGIFSFILHDDMTSVFPTKLKAGDRVRIIAPARSLSLISKETREIAKRRFGEIELDISFGEHVEENDEFSSSSIESRLADLHAAFGDQNIKAVITVLGGFNGNQLLKYINWDLIKNNPKIFCGYSDITVLQNAIYAKTGLVTYSGPHYSSFGQEVGFEYTLDYFKKCLFSDQQFSVTSSKQWSDDRWWENQNERKLLLNAGPYVISEGEAMGTILGANLCTFNLLQGTGYMPNLNDGVVFLEDDELCNPVLFDRDLQSLIHQPSFGGVKGIVIGRFQKASGITREKLMKIIKTKKELAHLPVVADVDFGHTSPMITFPIGGMARLKVFGNQMELIIERH